MIKENDKNEPLKYSKVKMKCDYNIFEKNDRMHTPFDKLKSGFIISINGYSGSGKTSLMVSLLSAPRKDGQRRSLKGGFHNIFCVSPSIHTLKNNIFENLPKECKHNDLNENTLLDFQDMIQQAQQEQTDEEPILSLLILDDCGDVLRENKKVEKIFNRIVMNRRHMNVSIIVLSQYFYMLAPAIRNNMNFFITYKPKSFKEEVNIFEAYVKKSKKHLRDFFDEIFKEKFDTLLIDMSLIKSADFVFYRNFKKIEFY